MERVFEDEFMDAQSSLISLCLELTGRQVDAIYAHCSIEKDSQAFNAFYRRDNKILSANDLGVERTMIRRFLNVGTLDLDNIRDVCIKHNKPTPNEIRMYYDVRSGKYHAEYKYVEVCTKKTGKCAGDAFDEWRSEIAQEIV